MMDVSFTYSHLACYIKSNDGRGQCIQNAEGIEKDVSLLNTEFL